MDDLISRQAAIDVCRNPEDGEDAYACGDDIQERLRSLPSAPQWIPVSERLPEEPYGCLVTVWDTEPMTCEEFENILPYFVGWDGEQWSDADGEQCPFEVIAWMPLPEPYKGDV